MVSHNDKWVRIYDIPETSQHKKGFTIYKVISMLYPERCPDAVTKITVWKRYNEFKKLHRELKYKHQSLRFKDKFPLLPTHPFFKRFNEDVIKERKAAILIFLEYIAKQPELFTSDVFVKFFESSHTPSNLLNGSINSIRADLQLPSEPEYLSYSSISSDDEHTLSDTDSISTLSSLSTSVQTVDLLADPLRKSTTSLTKSCKRNNVECLTTVSEHTSVDSLTITSIPPTPPQTPSLSNDDFSNEYIVEAARYITKATEMELEKRYDQAFSAYKQGIDILLSNVKHDTDIDRREKVRFKVERYLLRAEKIYNMYLSPEIKQINEIVGSEVQSTVQKASAELYKYKAIKIIESGMLVIHCETQELFFVKVIHKTCKYSSDYLVLPDNVPYMIKLRNYYDCENAVFLILQYSSAVKILDYIKQNYDVNQENLDCNAGSVESDNESEGSYTDLINEYITSKLQQDLKKSDIPKGNFGILNLSEETAKDNEDINQTRIEENNSNNLETYNMSFKPQKRLIDELTLINKQEALKPYLKKDDADVKVKEVFERQLSDRSLLDDFECRRFIVNPEDVVKWAAQLLLALEKLHTLGVICCDLNLNNLLIEENGDLTLTYMCSISDERIFKTNFDHYLAPELFRFDEISGAIDWWSYGVILYELLVGVSLKYAHPEGITNYTTLKVPKYVSSEGRSLLKHLLRYESSERLGCGVNGADDIKTHPFFNSISWDHLSSKCI